MRFVENWQRSWRWVSMQAFAVIIAGHMALGVLSTAEQEAIQRDYGERISVATVVMAFLGIFGRLTQQNGEPLSLPPSRARKVT